MGICWKLWTTQGRRAPGLDGRRGRRAGQDTASPRSTLARRRGTPLR